MIVSLDRQVKMFCEFIDTDENEKLTQCPEPFNSHNCVSFLWQVEDEILDDGATIP